VKCVENERTSTSDGDPLAMPTATAQVLT
jgi:hypothetical protein